MQPTYRVSFFKTVSVTDGVMDAIQGIVEVAASDEEEAVAMAIAQFAKQKPEWRSQANHVRAERQ